MVLACLAVASSALLRRTQAATVIAYGLTAALTIGTFIVYGGQRAMDGPIETASPAILALNPFVATADVVQGRTESSSFDSPFTALADLVRPDSFGFADGGIGVAGIERRVAIGKGFAEAPAMAVPVPAQAPAAAPFATRAGALRPDHGAGHHGPPARPAGGPAVAGARRPGSAARSRSSAARQ